MIGNDHVRFGGGPRGKGPEDQAPRRVAYPALDCLKPNLQTVQVIRPPEKTPETGAAGPCGRI